MNWLIPESNYIQRAEDIYRYLEAQGHRDLAAYARAGDYLKFYAWYLAADDSGSPLYETTTQLSRMTMYYNGVLWYQVYLNVQEAMGEECYGDHDVFLKLIAHPPEPHDESLLEEVFVLAEKIAKTHIENNSSDTAN